jgi:hypothetical protein
MMIQISDELKSGNVCRATQMTTKRTSLKGNITGDPGNINRNPEDSKFKPILSSSIS